jgi:hypothetical protein
MFYHILLQLIVHRRRLDEFVEDTKGVIRRGKSKYGQ